MNQPHARIDHAGNVVLTRSDGSKLLLLADEAAAIVALATPSARAGRAADNHLTEHARLGAYARPLSNW